MTFFLLHMEYKMDPMLASVRSQITTIQPVNVNATFQPEQNTLPAIVKPTKYQK